MGTPALRALKAQINLGNDLVKINNKILKLQYLNNDKEINITEVEDIKIRTDHLNEEEKSKLVKIIKEYYDIFSKENLTLTHTSTIKHEIKTTDETPVFTRSYRYPECYREEIKNQVNKLLNDGIIQESCSPWNSPVWMVPKKLDASGKRKFRMVIDYRKINLKTVDDKFPIPNITDVLDKLGKNIYYTTLDLASGFHQIPLHENSIQKTAFNTEEGHFEFKRMPFGLKNAPATFQRLMNHILRKYINKICLVYMDDIIILGTSLQEHTENIKIIFNVLREHNLKVQLDKSEFFKKEVAYLGHVVSEKGVKPNPNKINAVKNYPIPKTQKEIKTYLGLLGYYRKFIPNFAKLTKPLTNCLKKNNKIDINNEDYRESFEQSKNLLINSPILQYPDFSKQFVLTTDASNYAIGAVLSQNSEGKDLPIAYASRTLNDHEIHYSTIEKELLSIVWATKYFRPYLYGTKFKIYTDHRPLVWLMSLKDPSSKLVRWKIKLDEYDFEIEFKKGKVNSNADALSRIKPKFKIIETDANIFEKDNDLVHCISSDKQMSQGFAAQIDDKFHSKHYLHNKEKFKGEIFIQPIYKNKTLFHLVTKQNFFDTPLIEDIKNCLIKLKDFCIQNDTKELHMPKICCGLDKQNFEEIKTLIEKIFQETHLQIYIHRLPKEINLNDNESIIPQINESDSETVHSDDENDINGITYKDIPINLGKNQLIISTYQDETKIDIHKLFNTQKQRLTIQLNEHNLETEIQNFIKEYLVPNCRYYCLFEKDLHFKFNDILAQNFIKNSYKLIKCERLLEDIERIDDQLQTITDYHLGKTNHRGILETYQKLKQKFYWPNMYHDIQKYINNCEICQTNKYERNPFQIKNNLTETPDKPFQTINIDTLTLDKRKYLTIIDQFSKFAQIYHLKNLNAISIVNTLILYFKNYKIPDKIIHDSGTEFNNNLVKNLFNMYKIETHMTCVDNPKSNGYIERFHSTIIEHLRIINEREEFKNESYENKINFALIGYNNTMNQITKSTPLEIIFGKDTPKNPFDTNSVHEDYLTEYKDKLKIIHKIVKENLQSEKIKRYKPQLDRPQELPSTVLIKEGKRRIQKIKKPLFKIHKIEEYNPELGFVKINNNKKHKIDKLKRPRLYVTDTQTASKNSKK